jgi:hypothetical protein
MTWKVDPAGVQSVLTSVDTESQTVFTALGKVDGAVEGAAKNAQSQMIVSALSEFFGAMKPHITAMQNRIPAACDGAAAATMAIVQGDEQMALTAEHNAASAGMNGDFSVFGPSATSSGGSK